MNKDSENGCALMIRRAHSRWMMAVLSAVVVLCACSANTSALDSLRWQVQAALSLNHIQQQAKSAVGEPRGERLSYHLEFGAQVLASYQVWDYVHVGMFGQFDRGDRLSARFNGIDSLTGRTITTNAYSGDYSELWLGPFLRAQWKYVYGEFGWALVGTRTDALRSDLRTASGDSTGSFDLNPSVALFGSVGATASFTEQIFMVFRLEYRLRYYKGRAGQPFLNNIEHGMQNITPYVGVGWKF